MGTCSIYTIVKFHSKLVEIMLHWCCQSSSSVEHTQWLTAHTEKLGFIYLFIYIFFYYYFVSALKFPAVLKGTIAHKRSCVPEGPQLWALRGEQLKIPAASRRPAAGLYLTPPERTSCANSQLFFVFLHQWWKKEPRQSNVACNLLSWKIDK